MEKPAAKKVEKYDNLLPEPEKKKTEPKEKKRRRKKSPSIIDLLMPAPRFDPNDME
jgi:hypothetical protein